MTKSLVSIKANNTSLLIVRKSNVIDGDSPHTIVRMTSNVTFPLRKVRLSAWLDNVPCGESVMYLVDSAGVNSFGEHFIG